jgi:hypothetical protein
MQDDCGQSAGTHTTVQYAFQKGPPHPFNPVNNNNGAVVKTQKSLRWVFGQPRSVIIAVAASLYILPVASAAAEGCLSTDVKLSNWTEKEASQIEAPAGSARCWQSKSNSNLEMCLERTGEPKECKLAIRFQGRSIEYPVDENQEIVFSERKNSDKWQVALCDSIINRIRTTISFSKHMHVGIGEDVAVPEDEICVNGVGEILGIDTHSVFLGDYMVQVGVTKEWENFDFDQIEKVVE